MGAEHKTADPCVMVIFGATGDLTKRLLLPALYNLVKNGFLNEKFAIVGVGRQEMSSNEFRDQLMADLKEYAEHDLEKEKVEWFCERIEYTGGDFDDDKKLFGDIKSVLAEVCKSKDIPENFFYYMAIPPDLFANVATKVVENGLGKEENGNWRRFVFEKPFGSDLRSARKLNSDLLEILNEQQIYRIDHFLGKETVQNVLVFRFGNSVFEPVWNRNYIDHVQITVAETLGVEKRGNYYDKAGALRDMVPNHLFQLVTLTAMEPPVSFHADAVRGEQKKILDSIQPFDKTHLQRWAVRGQYDKGTLDGKTVPAYRDEPNVSKDSGTETFAALKLNIDNWRWADVPFYLRTGKRMTQKHSSIIIQFKKAPFVLFRETGIERLTRNWIEIHIQPDEGISLHFGAKIPGPLVQMGGVDMDFNYSDHFGDHEGTGYERLLYDVMIGDQTLFQSADMIETSWCVVDPVLDAWANENAKGVPSYPSGSWGPNEADGLIQNDGRKWRNPEASRLQSSSTGTNI
jgi:glucose-6-phosphate 1-dehydrogenase